MMLVNNCTEMRFQRFAQTLFSGVNDEPSVQVATYNAHTWRVHGLKRPNGLYGFVRRDAAPIINLCH